MQTHIRTPPEIHFIYVDKKEIYLTFFKYMLHNFCFIFQKILIFLSFSVQILLMFYTNHALKFKYKLDHLKVKCTLHNQLFAGAEKNHTKPQLD